MGDGLRTTHEHQPRSLQKSERNIRLVCLRCNHFLNRTLKTMSLIRESPCRRIEHLLLWSTLQIESYLNYQSLIIHQNFFHVLHYSTPVEHEQCQPRRCSCLCTRTAVHGVKYACNTSTRTIRTRVGATEDVKWNEFDKHWPGKRSRRLIDHAITKRLTTIKTDRLWEYEIVAEPVPSVDLS